MLQSALNASFQAGLLELPRHQVGQNAFTCHEHTEPVVLVLPNAINITGELGCNLELGGHEVHLHVDVALLAGVRLNSSTLVFHVRDFEVLDITFAGSAGSTRARTMP